MAHNLDVACPLSSLIFNLNVGIWGLFIHSSMSGSGFGRVLQVLRRHEIFNGGRNGHR